MIEMSGATVFLLFWLYLDNEFFKIAAKFYLSHPAILLVVTQTNFKIACYFTSGSFLLFINNYC